jgi:membrane-bound lytic murein transglycosylase MltF
MRMWMGIVVVSALMSSACSTPAPRPATPSNTTPAAPALIDIKPAPDQPISDREKTRETATIDLDAIVERGFIRILVAPSRTYFETGDGRHHGRAVDTGVALAKAIADSSGHEVAAVFIETREDQLIPALLAGKGDIAANLMLTFARDDQVAFAPPIVTNIREIVVTSKEKPMVTLEDVGGREIHVRKDSYHHESLVRLNDQLKKVDRPAARVIVDAQTKTDEDLLERVNGGRIPATIVDDYIFDRWKNEFPNIAANKDVSVSTGGILAWVTRKDAPVLAAALKEFFTTHKLTF